MLKVIEKVHASAGKETKACEPLLLKLLSLHQRYSHDLYAVGGYFCKWCWGHPAAEIRTGVSVIFLVRKCTRRGKAHYVNCKLQGHESTVPKFQNIDLYTFQ